MKKSIVGMLALTVMAGLLTGCASKTGNRQLIKTPVVRNGKQATVGYQPDTWKGWN